MISIAVVVAIVVIFVGIKLTSSSSSSPTGPDTSGQHPAIASISQMVQPVATIPAAVFNSIGTAGEPATMQTTKNQKELKTGSLPRFVYEGGEYCPYCAMARWSMVAALARFGTFSNLKMTSSATTDRDIVTFSFYGSTYTSKYVSFTPYEALDRKQSPLMTVPKDVLALYGKYDGNSQTGVAAAPFNPGSPGIPFIDIANRYVSSGWPAYFNPVYNALSGGGPNATQAASAAAIAAAMHDPTTPVASAISAKFLIGTANYFSAAICNVDGQKPTAVCSSPGVKTAKTGIAAVTAVG